MVDAMAYIFCALIVLVVSGALIWTLAELFCFFASFFKKG
jgi:hypothetical protein